MSIADEYSVYCKHPSCGIYNVDGYCASHLVEFFNWLKKKKVKLTEDNFEDLWEEFEGLQSLDSKPKGKTRC